MKSVVVDVAAYDWEGDRAARAPARARRSCTRRTSRGFTAHPSSGVAPGGGARTPGSSSKHPVPRGPRGQRGRAAAGVRSSTAWRRPAGRSTTGATSRSRSSRPTRRTAAGPARPGAVDEFRDLVKALHRAGLEVILDVVYNHTAEGGAGRARRSATAGWPTTSTTSLGPGDRSRTRDYSGTRQHVQRERPDRPPADPRQPALLGRGDARRRLPVRPRRRCCRATRTATPLARPPVALGHRQRPGPRRHEAHRRGVGRGGPVPGRHRSSATAGSSGTAGSGTTSGRSSGATRAGCAAVSAAAHRQPGPLRPRGPRAPDRRSTS